VEGLRRNTEKLWGRLSVGYSILSRWICHS